MIKPNLVSFNLLRRICGSAKINVRVLAKATPNNSMDVRRKQQLCYLACPFPSRCAVAVSPHVISTVGRATRIVFWKRFNFTEVKEKSYE